MDGLDAAAVLREIDELLSVAKDDSVRLELGNGDELACGTGMGHAPFLSEFYRPVAQALVALQESTREALLMPDMGEIQAGQLDGLQELVSLYQAPVITHWKETRLHMPDGQEAEKVRAGLRRIAEGGVQVAFAYPELELGNRRIVMARPLVSTQHSCRIQQELDIDSLKAGDEVVLVPDGDSRVTTAPLADWSRGSGA